MSSAYANIFSCSSPIYIPLGTIFILCITFWSTKLNNIGDKGSPCFRPVLFSKKYDNVPSNCTSCLLYTCFTHIYWFSTLEHLKLAWNKHLDFKCWSRMTEAVTISMSDRSSSCKYTWRTRNNISGLSCHSTLPLEYNLIGIFFQSQYIHAVA
jgi:hypothetical protein